MKELEFELSDAGWYVADPGNEKERWCLAHPTEGYSPTGSGRWEIYVESMQNANNKNPIKFLGTACSRKEAENYVFDLININKGYHTLKEAEYNY